MARQGNNANSDSACITSFVNLSQSPVFRHRWASTYEALQDSRLPRAKVQKLLVSQIPTHQQPVLAGNTVLPLSQAAFQLKQVSHQLLAAIGTPASAPKTAENPQDGPKVTSLLRVFAIQQ